MREWQFSSKCQDNPSQKELSTQCDIVSNFLGWQLWKQQRSEIFGEVEKNMKACVLLVGR